MKLDPRDRTNDIITELLKRAARHGYTKIIAKVPDHAISDFTGRGFQTEGSIPQFYKGKETVHFMSLFIDEQRGKLSQEAQKEVSSHIETARAKSEAFKNVELPGGFEIRTLSEKDIPQLVVLYKTVFPVYPFPIFDEEYIRLTMREHIQYFGVFDKDTLCAASSAEIDHAGLNAEMTDFATSPDYLGLNLSYLLLQEMERSMKYQHLKTLYTIARSKSIGMNTTFSRLGYTLSGTLVNNTLIGDGIETMNVWHKNIPEK